MNPNCKGCLQVDQSAEIERLRSALEFIEKMSREHQTEYIPRTMGDIARAALGEQK